MKGKFKNAGTHIILIIASFISVFPLYWMIAAATKDNIATIIKITYDIAAQY